jgi:transposase
MADARTIWKQRVRDWRASGESAERYAVGRGFAGSTLKWWASKLRKPNSTPIVRVAQLIRSGSDGHRRGAIVVEGLEGGVRITIEPGADRETITTVLAIVAAPRSQQ